MAVLLADPALPGFCCMGLLDFNRRDRTKRLRIPDEIQMVFVSFPALKWRSGTTPARLTGQK
ncbi:hypothetical protein ACFFJ7_18645 [Pseudochelatococcus lubricantis]|uniref:hypothetical protein n=1 Tax=Pseudochelatococcus lubricantis TaxID=1538102 RepID=UPI0035EBD9F5